MKRTAAAKDVTTAPLVRWQKSLNCRQMGTQLALWFPLWARYTIAAAEAAAAVDDDRGVVSAGREERSGLGG
ncbi:unnamed protein product [Spirodela intermedia]|uniref:Uncharacterized protein n=1 Tax=Spirodela intermedia TaxID=51605 RepID=A0A7I8IRM7_SPIIN|nr:unnamed protein product [Spirodela intermedia]CAA6660641.1 unnamed protein product [Spirodela intermedia]